MPAVTHPAKVLVTGASGFLGIHTVLALVERGYNVVGTVRTSAKGEYVNNIAKRNFEYVLVPDIEQPGAFDEAVKGVDAIEHLASPVEMPAGDPQPIISASIAGTLNILEAAKKNAPTVKRVVITSSRVAVGPELFEDTWNDASVKEVQEQGAAADPVAKYAAAKVLAERAAWDFIKKNADAVPFDIVVTLPPWIWGPQLQEGSTFSADFLLSGLDPAAPKTGKELTQIGGFFVDVRDCGAAHAELLVHDKAANERFIPVSGPWSWHAIYQALDASPALQDVPAADSNVKSAEPPKYTTKYLNLIGKSPDEVFRPFNATFRDVLQNARHRGWTPAQIKRMNLTQH